MDRRRRAKLTKRYFKLKDDAVDELNQIFQVLDTDGSEEIMISELHEAEGLLRTSTRLTFN